MTILRIKQISNSDAFEGAVIAFDGGANIWRKINHTQVVEIADLDNDHTIVINHGLGRKYVNVNIYDDSDILVMPNLIQAIDANHILLDFTSFVEQDLYWTVTIS